MSWLVLLHFYHKEEKRRVHNFEVNEVHRQSRGFMLKTGEAGICIEEKEEVVLKHEILFSTLLFHIWDYFFTSDHPALPLN